MMVFYGIHHVGLVTTNKERSVHFLHEILGLQQHERISSWFFVGQCVIHLNEVPAAGIDHSLYHQLQHVALEVDDLGEILRRLLMAALEPFQLDFKLQKQALKDPDADLSYGTGTIFVTDPDGNLFEFIQIGCGLFAHEPDPFVQHKNQA